MQNGRRWLIRCSVLATTAALAILTSAPAFATDPVATLSTWSPADVSGTWTSQPGKSLSVNLDKRDVCTGSERNWTDESRRIDIRLDWAHCPSSQSTSAWRAYYEQNRQAESAQWRTAPAALGANRELIDGLISGNQRSWIQGNYLITVDSVCRAATAQACAEFSRTIVSDLAGRMGIAPTNLAGGRSIQLASFTLGFSLVVMMILGLVAAVHAVMRHRFVFADSPGKWFAVDSAARQHRRRDRFRRHGRLLILPTVVFAVVLGLDWTVSAVTPIDVAGFLLPALFAIPGVALLSAGRDRYPVEQRWRSSGALLRAALTWVLMALSTAVLCLQVVLGLFGFATDGALPEELGSDTLTALLILLLLPATGLSWSIALRRETDAWRIRNRQPGRPIVVLGGFGERSGWIWVKRTRRRGPSNLVTQLIVPTKPRRFTSYLPALLAGHGPVATVGPVGRTVTGPATRIPLHPDRWSEALGQQVRDSRVVVIAVGGSLGNSPVGELAAVAVESSATPIMLVMSPGSAEQITAWYAAWYAAARAVAPFHLLPPTVPTGTHVLVHVPGHGWAGWGATRRDGWTYLRAVDDALAYVYMTSDADDRPHASAPPPNDPAELARQPGVAILACPTDAPMAAAVSASVAAMGLLPVGPAEVGRAPVRAVVVVLTPAATADPAWCAEYMRIESAGTRVVAVRRESLSRFTLPGDLSGQPRLDWADTDAARSALFVALTSDPAEYETHRDLVYQARGWIAARRDPALLISDQRGARAAADHIARSSGDPLSRPGSLLVEYVDASVALGRRQQRASRSRIGTIAGAALLLVALLVVGVHDYRTLIAHNAVGKHLVALPGEATADPALAAVTAAAAVIDGDTQESADAREALTSLLGQQPWPTSSVAVADHTVRDVAVLPGGDLLVLDNTGMLTRVAASTDATKWRRAVGSSATAIDADANQIAVADARSIHLVTPDTGQAQTVNMGGTVRDVALDGADRLAVADIDSTRLATVGLGPSNPVRPAGTYRRVFVVRHLVDGGVRALVDTGTAIEVLDPLDHTHAARLPLPEGSEVVSGALDATGTRVVVVTANGQAYYGALAAPTSLGAALGTTAGPLAVLPGDRVVAAPPGRAPQVYDMRSGLVTDRLNSTLADISQLYVSDDGDTLVVASGGSITTWATAALGSLAGPGRGAHLSSSAAPTLDNAQLRADGTVTATDHYGIAHILTAVSGTVTAAVLSADGRELLVGSDHGDVAEVDLVGDGGVADLSLVRSWKSPNGAAIRAVGWSAAPGRLMIQTADGAWWQPTSCDGCGTATGVLGALRSHLLACYSNGFLTGISPADRQQLGLHTCGQGG